MRKIKKAIEEIDKPQYLKAIIAGFFGIIVTGAAFYMTFGYAMGKDISAIKANQVQLMKNMEKTQAEITEFRNDFNNFKLAVANSHNESIMGIRQEMASLNTEYHSRMNKVETRVEMLLRDPKKN